MANAIQPLNDQQQQILKELAEVGEQIAKIEPLRDKRSELMNQALALEIGATAIAKAANTHVRNVYFNRDRLAAQQEAV